MAAAGDVHAALEVTQRRLVATADAVASVDALGLVRSVARSEVAGLRPSGSGDRQRLLIAGRDGPALLVVHVVVWTAKQLFAFAQYLGVRYG